jgi:hypothetical protein
MKIKIKNKDKIHVFQCLTNKYQLLQWNQPYFSEVNIKIVDRQIPIELVEVEKPSVVLNENLSIIKKTNNT